MGCHVDTQMVDCGGHECLIQQCLHEFKKNDVAEGGICDNNGDFHESLRDLCILAINPFNDIQGPLLNPGPVRDELMCCPVKCEQAGLDKLPLTCNTTEQFWHPDDTIKDCAQLCGSDHAACHHDSVMVDCSAEECLVEQCLAEFKKKDIEEGMICDNTGQFHFSLRTLCEVAIVPGSEVTGILLNPDPVRDPALCCPVACDQNHSDVKGEVCTSKGVILPDVKAFCHESCEAGGELKCPAKGQDECPVEDLFKCCMEQCLVKEAGHCNADYEFIPKEEYCKQTCLPPYEVPTDHHDCSGCNENDCQLMKCMHENSDLTSFCLMSDKFFNNVDAYCAAQLLDNTEQPLVCEPGACDDDERCCTHVCLLTHSDKICDSEYRWHETVDEFCKARCPERTLTQQPNITSEDACTTTTTCVDDPEYLPLCTRNDQGYSLLPTHDDYCRFMETNGEEDTHACHKDRNDKLE